MAINKRRDFKRLSVSIKEFLSKLPCDESTGFLRDTLYLSLLELHKYYVKEKDRLNFSLRNSNGPEKLADVFKAKGKGAGQICNGVDKYESRWCGYHDDSNETESQGFLAAHQGNLESLKDLVNSDDVDPVGQTYLMYAVHNGSSRQLECIQHILSLNFDINSQANDGTTALHVACQYEQKQAIVELLKNKADPTIKDNKGRAPLHWAAIGSSTEITKLLLQYGADINVRDCDAMTPMMCACHFNKIKNMHILKNAHERFDPTTDSIFYDKDKNGRTVLHWAVPVGNNYGLDCLEHLLKRDVSHMRDNQGRTVLHIAAKKGSVPACELILSVCGEEMLHLKDNQDQTALHLATLCGHGETVDYLLQCGANVPSENNAGRTAKQEAEFGHYHYCLLVFAAFEQMKPAKENKSVEKIEQEVEDGEESDKRAKRYESWIIPTGFLNDSQEVPGVNAGHDDEESQDYKAQTSPDIDKYEDPKLTEVQDTNKVDHQRNLVDVNEIEGFEVTDNSGQNNQIKNNKGNSSHIKSNPRITLQRSKQVDEEKRDEMVDGENGQGASNGIVTGGQLPDESLKGYSSNYLQQQGSASSGIGGVSSDPENESISENIEVSSLGDDSDEEKSEQEWKDSENELSETKQKTNKDKSQAKANTPTETKNERPHFPEAIHRRGNLAPINDTLTKPSFGIPSKLDPIPLHGLNKLGFTSKSSGTGSLLPRSIVAPLQPPAQPVAHQNDISSSGGGSLYGQRGPGHGPLAHAHGKELLNNVFQDSSRVQVQKSPETQRRLPRQNNNPGRLPHPPRY